MKVYISGPISGVSEYESMAAFNDAENKLVAAGCQVVNPRMITRWGLTWDTYMQIAEAVLYSGEIDAVLMLRGWQQSKGACIEKVWANAKGIQVIYQGGGENDQ